MATLKEILAVKGPTVHTITACRTALEAIVMMNEHRIGALVVTEGGRVAGMFTERDVLRRVVTHHRPPAQLLVQEVMTPEVLTGRLAMTVEEASRIMKDRRIRHLPVTDSDGWLLGLVSIGDVNAFHADAQASALRQLEDYVYSGL
jgi:CBS domain-containing protein